MKDMDPTHYTLIIDETDSYSRASTQISIDDGSWQYYSTDKKILVEIGAKVEYKATVSGYGKEYRVDINGNGGSAYCITLGICTTSQKQFTMLSSNALITVQAQPN